MENVPCKNVKVHHMMLISSCLVGTTFGNLFGIGFPPPVEVPILNPRFGEVSEVNSPNNPKMQQTTNPPFDWDNLFSNNWSNNYNQNNNFFYPAPDTFFETFKTKPQQPQNVNKLTKDNSMIFVSGIPIKKGHGPYDFEKVGSLKPKPNQDSGVLEVVSDDSAIHYGSKAASDHTTEAADYETTTDHEGDIGGAPPAIVASLLG